jgi:hypothetical protein
MSEVNFTEALNLTKRINTIRIGGKDIQEFFMYEGYNYWQSYQTEIFIRAKQYTVNPDHALQEIRRSRAISFVSGLLAFVISLIAHVRALLQKSRVIVYSVDKHPAGKERSDFRLKELYNALTDNKISFMEILHSSGGRSVIRNLLKRGRPAVYTSAGEFVARVKMFGVPQSDLQVSFEENQNLFTQSEELFVRELILSLSVRFARVPHIIAWMRRLIRISRISHMYLIDDAWHYFDLLVAAQAEGVHTTAIQHGHFTKYHVGVLPCTQAVQGMIIRPEKLIVWSSYWKGELERLGSYYPADAILVGGQKDTMSERVTSLREDERIGVLIPYETEVPKGKMSAYLYELKKCPHIQIYFKPRSDLSLDAQLNQYGLSSSEGVSIVKNLSEETGIQVALGTYTTYLYDVVRAHIPVIVAVDILDYGEGMVRNGLADAIDSPAKICRQVQVSAQITDSVREERIIRLCGRGEGSLEVYLKKYTEHQSTDAQV